MLIELTDVEGIPIVIDLENVLEFAAERGGTRFWQNVGDADGDLFFTQVTETYAEIVDLLRTSSVAFLPARDLIRNQRGAGGAP